MITTDGILYIEPVGAPSAEPVIDDLTRRMASALFLGEPGPGYRGFHTCSCGVHSSNCNYTLPNGETTNSLCVHYLAFHREDVPQEQLDRVAALEYYEIGLPSDDDLEGLCHGVMP